MQRTFANGFTESNHAGDMDLVKNTRFFRENRKSMGRFDINYFTLNAVVARKSSSGKHTNHDFEFHGCWLALNVLIIQNAVVDAELNPEDIGYINAHGTGTRLNDPLECRAIHKIFGDRASTLPVSSNKSVFGHAMGASSALEALATLLAVQNDCVPPTLNCDEQDPECDIDPVPTNSRKLKIEAALSNSFAFGGSNAVLAIRKWNP